MVQPTRGISLNTDAEKVDKYGGAHEIKSIPDELEIVQQGRDLGHHELRPKAAIAEELFYKLLELAE